MIGRDPVTTVRKNADALARERQKTGTAERLLGRDAAALYAPELDGARGDPLQTTELLFGAGNAVRDLCPTVSARRAFISALIEKTGLSETDLFPVPNRTETRVLYARAGAADRAYRLFSQILSDPRVGYASSNVEAAEGVESGDADLLLLPYADADGNRVISTQTLSETHGLLLSALARVRVGDGLIYGLYGRAILPVSNARLTLHLSIPSPDTETLAGLYGFAASCDLDADGAVIPPDGGRASLSLSGKRADCLAAAVYSLAFCPGCELRGLRAAQPLSER